MSRECILTLFKGISLRDDFVRTFDSILRFNRQDKRHFFSQKSGTKKKDFHINVALDINKTY